MTKGHLGGELVGFGHDGSAQESSPTPNPRAIPDLSSHGLQISPRAQSSHHNPTLVRFQSAGGGSGQSEWMQFGWNSASALVVGGAAVVLVLLSANFKAGAMLGGKKEVDVSDTNSLEIDELANFAVSEHNNRQNSLEKLNFSKVVSCHKQVVSGLMYHMVIEVEEASKPKQFEAKVWVKPGGASKKLEEFKPKDGGLTSADLGVKSTGVPLTRHSHGPPTGKQTVPVDDPVVQEAAQHAMRMLQQGSNSLATYELSEVVSAEAELKDESATFDLLLRTKRGTKEEHFKSEVHRTGDGQWSVKHATLQ